MNEINGIPVLGYGTWNVRGTEGQAAIEHALQVGYRHIDTADYYKNHDIVGAAMQASGIDRGKVYLVTKVFPPLGAQKVLADTQRFLEELSTDYIDLLLIHWPGSTPVQETLAAMRDLQQQGLVRNIGVSNFDEEDLDEAVDHGIEITNNQIEIHPGQLRQSVVDFCQARNISVTAYSPLAQAGSLTDEMIMQIARKYDAKPAQIILSWLMSKNLIVIPKAINHDHISENFASRELSLNPEDIIALDGL